MSDLGASGTSVIVSSHVMHEVQAMTDRFLLIYGGRILASGEVREIRELMYEVPHRICIRCDRPRFLGSKLAALPAVEGIELDPEFIESSGEQSDLWVRTREPRGLFQALPQIAADAGIFIDEISSQDDSLDAVFEYLVGGGI